MLAISAVLLTFAQAVPPMPGQAPDARSQGPSKSDSKTQDANSRSAPPVPVRNPTQPPEDAQRAGNPTSDDKEHSVKLTSLPPVTLADKQKTFWELVFDWGPWAFGLFLAIAGGVQLWLLKITWKTIHEQRSEMAIQTGVLKDSVVVAQQAADAAEKSASGLANSERAWLLVEKVWFGSHPDKLGQTTIPWGELVIRCETKNYGRTPARVLDVRAMIEFGSTHDPSRIPLDERIYESSGIAVPRWVVLTDRKQTFYAVQFDSSRPEQEFKVTGNTRICFIHGTIEYWDMFSETRRFTRFCFRWDSTDGNRRQGEEFIREGEDSYNQQT